MWIGFLRVGFHGSCVWTLWQTFWFCFVTNILVLWKGSTIFWWVAEQLLQFPRTAVLCGVCWICWCRLTFYNCSGKLHRWKILGLLCHVTCWNTRRAGTCTSCASWWVGVPLNCFGIKQLMNTLDHLPRNSFACGNLYCWLFQWSLGVPYRVAPHAAAP